jgi:AraC-like DNA-binding protein
MSDFALNPGWGLMLKQFGVEPAHVLQRAGLPGDLFSREWVRVPAEQFYALWRAIEAEANDDDLPLHLIQAMTAEVFDPPIFAALCSPHLQDAARRIAQYKPLVGPMKLQVHVGPEETTIHAAWPTKPEAPPPLGVVTELLFWVGLARLGTGHAVEPLRITAPLPHNSEAQEAWVGCPVEAGPECTVVFADADATRPFLTANSRMWTFFEPELRRRLAELNKQASAEERVRAALVELLPAGKGSMQDVARKLGVSTRTLQRRLRDESTTFQACVAGVRESLARHYLTSTAMPAAEISFLLGYSDPNSFYRAFHTWTGSTPETVRAAARH